TISDLYGVAGLLLLGFRNELNVYDGSPQLQRLAQSLTKLASPNGQLPPGAYPRSALKRNNYPYEPEKRVSWMAELLPYLGHSSLYAKIQREQSWDATDNLLIAHTVIPEFLDPSYPKHSHFVAYPGLKVEAAATHYVGLGGIGEDVAD